MRRGNSLDSPRELSPEAVVDAVPRCCYGHPIIKCKKLKPWQVDMAGHNCALCDAVLHRLEFRWRCSEHCAWDMCQHCYENHWNHVIEEATSIKDRQQRLAMLSAVPVLRRQAKDFEGAFGDNPQDARLLLPPARAPPASSREEPRLESLESARSIDFELTEETAETLQLMCPAGHVVKKKKRLKPWQDVMARTYPCAECQEPIGRDAFRWRCEHHCSYNVCDPCYEQHWAEIIAMVQKTRDEEKCWQLLSAVPLYLRDRPEYHAAQARVARRAVKEAVAKEHQNQVTLAEEKAAMAAYGTEAGPADFRGRVTGALAAADKAVEQHPMLQLAFWTLLAVTSELSAAELTREIQGPSAPGSRSPAQVQAPFLVASLSTLLGAALLQGLLWALRKFRRKYGEIPPMPAPPPSLWFLRHARNSFPRRRRRRRQVQTQEAPRFSPEQPQLLQVYIVLGLLLGFELALTEDSRFRAPGAADCLGLGLAPLAMLLTGLLCSAESCDDHRLVLATFLASLAGLLVVPGAWRDPEREYDMMSCACLSATLCVVRWTLTNNVLPPFDYLPSERFTSALVLAANMAVTAGAALLELSIVFNLTGFFRLVEITRPLLLAKQMTLLGVAQAVRLLAYLSLARTGSFPLMGFVPLLGVAASVIVEFTTSFAEGPATWINLLGACLGFVAFAYFALPRRLRPAPRAATPAEGYEPLSDGGESGFE